MSDAKWAQVVDLALQIQGLAEEALSESSSTAFKTPAPTTPLAQSMVGLPDVSQIKWTFGKGDSKTEARPDDPLVWAFTYTYDRDAQKSTTTIRPEAEQLVVYLDAHDNKLEMDGYSYFIGSNKSFLNREKL